MSFIVKYRDRLFSQVPIAFIAVEAPTMEDVEPGHGSTGVINLGTHKQTVDLALTLHPNTEQVFVVSGTLQRDGKWEALCLYRIAQEALHNVTKHSGAKEVWISVAEVNNHVQLRIEDAGRGCDTHQIRANNGLGLASMRERARMIGGTFEFRARVGGGAEAVVVVPMPKQVVAKE